LQVEAFQLQDYVTLVYAPIEKVPAEFVFKAQETWYSTVMLNEVLKMVDSIDLILVDGPFGGGTPFARYSAVPFLKQKLTPDFSVFLDDSERDDEKEMILEWKTMLDSNITYFKRYTMLSTDKSFESKPHKL